MNWIPRILVGWGAASMFLATFVWLARRAQPTIDLEERIGPHVWESGHVGIAVANAVMFVAATLVAVRAHANGRPGWVAITGVFAVANFAMCVWLLLRPEPDVRVAELTVPDVTEVERG